MKYDLEGVCQDCIYLEKIRPLFEEKDKEIERLNNIINELEKWLKSKIDYFDKTAKDTILHEQMVILIIYDYLQELKGSDIK